jgi:hypothetical protein
VARLATSCRKGAKRALILELRDLFNLLIIVSKDHSLIAVVGSYYSNCYRRVVCATAVFRLFLVSKLAVL